MLPVYAELFSRSNFKPSRGIALASWSSGRRCLATGRWRPTDECSLAGIVRAGFRTTGVQQTGRTAGRTRLITGASFALGLTNAGQPGGHR